MGGSFEESRSLEMKIKKMPSKRTLEIFLEGMTNKGIQNNVGVTFNIKSGEFERNKK